MSPRLLATGDLHLGAGRSYSDDRIADQARVLAQITAIAKSNDVDTVLLAGDTFHRADPPIGALHALRDFLAELTTADIPVVAITGNRLHDIVNADEPCAVELFASSTVHVLRQPGLARIGDTAVACLPNVPVDRLLALRGGRDGDVNAEAVALLLETAAGLYAEADLLPWARRKVLLGHWAVTGATLPTGLPSESLTGEPVLPLDALEAMGWDWIVMGHLHQPQRIGRRTLYTGSPQVVDFGEAHVEHGVWIIDTDEGAAEFVPVADRPFVTLDIDLARDFTDDVVPDALAALATSEQIGEAVVRVRIRCTEQQARLINQAAIRRDLLDAGAHRVWVVDVQPVVTQRARAEQIDTAVGLPEQIRMWAAAVALEQGDLDSLLALASEIGAGS